MLKITKVDKWGSANIMWSYAQVTITWLTKLLSTRFFMKHEGGIIFETLSPILIKVVKI